VSARTHSQHFTSGRRTAFDNKSSGSSAPRGAATFHSYRDPKECRTMGRCKSGEHVLQCESSSASEGFCRTRGTASASRWDVLTQCLSSVYSDRMASFFSGSVRRSVLVVKLFFCLEPVL